MLARLVLFALVLLPAAASAQLRWQEGRHYLRLPGDQTAGVPAGKIEVAEVFSYGCIHCYRAKDQIAKLAAGLPADAALTYVHASFAPAEAWPMFQRAFYAAQALGVAETLHDAMFAAVWETREVPLLDASGRISNPLPTIEDAAKFYARLGKLDLQGFLRVAASPPIDAQVRRADALVKAWRVPGTPTLVVNGRYLIDNSMLSSWDEQRQLVNFLVGLERSRLKAAAAPAP